MQELQKDVSHFMQSTGFIRRVKQIGQVKSESSSSVPITLSVTM